MDNVQFLQAILQLGWPAIVMIQCWLLWRDNLKLRDELITAYRDCHGLPDKQPDENPIGKATL